MRLVRVVAVVTVVAVVAMMAMVAVPAVVAMMTMPAVVAVVTMVAVMAMPGRSRRVGRHDVFADELKVAGRNAGRESRSDDEHTREREARQQILFLHSGCPFDVSSS